MILIVLAFPSITSSGCHSDASEWVLNTGSTYHICPIRELFASYEELDGGLMFMRDENTCRLVGKGTVHIKMYDGIMRELKEVRYIPRMAKNLISVGALKAEASEGLLEKAFSRCLVARWLF